LRAVLADVPFGERPPPPAPAPAAISVSAPAAIPPPASRDWILLAGVGWLRAGDVQTLAPALSLTWLGRHVGARLMVTGFGTSTERSRAAGNARVGQEVALAELLGCWRPRG